MPTYIQGVPIESIYINLTKYRLVVQNKVFNCTVIIIDNKVLEQVVVYKYTTTTKLRLYKVIRIYLVSSCKRS